MVTFRTRQGAQPPPGGGNLTIAQVFQQKGLWAWFSSPITNYWNGVTEKGLDYSTTFGTPVAVPVGGKIIYKVWSPLPAVNNIVLLQDSSGGVWLYQHITASVSVGQTLQCGDVIGTENGMPPSQYSTGPHIEVRYLPPGAYDPKIDPWFLPWPNPYSLFTSLANQTAGSVGNLPPGGSLGGNAGPISFVDPFSGIQSGTPGTYIPVLDQIHQTLIGNTGFYAIALTLDEAEQFPGYVDLRTPTYLSFGGSNPVISAIGGAVGIQTTTSIPIPDITGTIRSIGATFTDNFTPFALRASIVGLGMFIILTLIAKALAPVAGDAVKAALPLLMG